MTDVPAGVSTRARPWVDGEPSPVQRSILPVLDGDEHGVSARLAEALGRDRPKRTFFVGLFIAFVAIAVASILLGVLVKRSVTHS